MAGSDVATGHTCYLPSWAAAAEGEQAEEPLGRGQAETLGPGAGGGERAGH